jgi:hypothetical protein
MPKLHKSVNLVNSQYKKFNFCAKKQDYCCLLYNHLMNNTAGSVFLLRLCHYSYCSICFLSISNLRNDISGSGNNDSSNAQSTDQKNLAFDKANLQQDRGKSKVKVELRPR